MKTATISRVRIYPSGGGGYRAAWRWLYSATVDGVEVLAGFDRLGSLESTCKRRGWNPVRAWSKTIDENSPEACDHCHGCGTICSQCGYADCDAGDSREDCDECAGTGRRRGAFRVVLQDDETAP